MRAIVITPAGLHDRLDDNKRERMPMSTAAPLGALQARKKKRRTRSYITSTDPHISILWQAVSLLDPDGAPGSSHSPSPHREH